MRHAKRAVGKILIPDDSGRTEAVVKDEDIVCYARDSSAMNKNNLDSQGQHLTDDWAARGYIVKQVVKEGASGWNDKRSKLIK